jgi:hypothetical protein
VARGVRGVKPNCAASSNSGTMSSLLRHYKAFVRQHPSLVVNAERLLHWLAWNPERFSGSE